MKKEPEERDDIFEVLNKQEYRIIELEEAVRDYQKIAQQSKVNCGPKLKALIQAALQKHAGVIDE